MDTKRTEVIKNRYDRISPLFNVMDRMMREDWRLQVISQVSGKVLEVGVGTGANLSYYRDDVALTGIDFSPGMLRYARKKADSLHLHVELLEMDAQCMDFPANTFDFVLATCVYCSVPDPVLGLKEMRRICKPQGKVLLLEHMRSVNPLLGMAMDVFNPLVVRISGANINRRTLDNIAQAGFVIEENKMLMGSIVRKLVLNPNKS